MPALPPDVETFEQLLGDLRGSKVQIRVPQRGDKKTLQETVARNAARVAGAAQDQAGQRPDHPQPGAGGDPAGARARRGAAADRVLRRLQPPGHRGGRLDGGLRGRAGPQGRVPPVRDQGRRRAERRRLDARGDHPAVPAAARRAGHAPSSSRATTTSGPMLVDPETGRPRKFAYAPGLVVVDGGPPQVAAAQRALDELGIDDIPVVRAGQAAGGGLAARPGGPGDPARAPPRASTCCSGSATRRTGSRSPTTGRGGPSRWSRACSTTYPGLGEVRRKTLLKHFGSLKKLREAEVEDIAQVPGHRHPHRDRDQGRGGREPPGSPD